MTYIGVVNGMALDLVKPQYPTSAKKLGIGGTVTVRVLIDPRGCVNESIATAGPAILKPPSVKAAQSSIFSPTKLSGIPIWLYGMVVYQFLPKVR
ncbi:MAG: energy transducer TonB [Acidobacteria bacterium]|nr:energy transducer TonB [Acidobacteriota bacterium]